MATDVSTQPIKARPEFAGILKEDVRFSTGRQDAADRVNGWFDQLVLQSGLGAPPVVLLLLSLLTAIAVGGAIFVLQENLLSTAFGAVIGFFIPLAVVLFLRSRRQTQILNQLPSMIGELARAARTGRSLEQCMNLVANDTPNPLGGELQLCARRMAMGLSPEAALRDLPERTGIQTLNVLVTALTVHYQTGGDLAGVLDRLAQTIRDRISFVGRLRAQTSASRATSILMITVPIGVLGFFILRDPSYMQRLMSSGWGRYSTFVAILFLILGSIWVVRILQNTAKS